jgi:hypothetical protein
MLITETSSAISYRRRIDLVAADTRVTPSIVHRFRVHFRSIFLNILRLKNRNNQIKNWNQKFEY